jgi:hypothetical protein
VKASRGRDFGDEGVLIKTVVHHSAESLAGKGYKINLQKKFLSRGYLIWEQEKSLQ